MNAKITVSSVKSYVLGFLLFFIAVIVADIYGGSGVVNLYYAGAFLICLSEAPRCIRNRRVPLELILYFILAAVVDLRNGQRSMYFLMGLVQLLTAALAASYLTSARRLRHFVNGLALSLALSCVYFLLFATNDVLKAIDSELRHALPFFSVSSAGLMTALGYFLGLVYFLAKKDIKWLLLCLLSLGTCLYTLSKNALLAIVIITVVYLFIAGVIRLNKSILIAMAVLIVVLPFAGGLLRPVLELYSEAIDTNSSSGLISIAGRGGIWLYCLQAIPESPWVGYGYYSSSELLIQGLGEEFTQAHNGLLHCLISTGIIGTILLTVYFIRVTVFIISNRRIIMRFTYLRWILCMLMYFVFRSFTEASFAQCINLDTYLFFLLSLTLMGFVNKRKKMLKIVRLINESSAG